MVHRPPLMAATAAATAHAGLRGGGGVGGGDRGSIYRNGDLYIARRGLCIASTHPAQSPPPVPHRPPTPDVASAPLRTANVRGWDRGCAGVAAGLRGPPYGTEVLYAVRAGSMKPGHTIPSARQGYFSYVEMHPPFSSPVLKARPRARGRRMRRRFRCGTRRRRRRFQRRSPNVAS